MVESVKQLLTHLAGMWRYRWHAVAMAWAVAIAGGIFVFMLPPKYQSQGRIFVDTESVLRPLLSGLAVGTDVGSEVNLVTRVLLSRPSLETVARKTDLHMRADDRESFEGMIESLRERTRIEGGGRDNLYTISFEDADPVMAQRVVQTFVTTLVEDTLGMKRTDSSSAQRFLEQQIAEYEQRLNEAEERLAEFKRRNVGLMPEAGEDYYAKLTAAQQSLDGVREKLRLATAKRDELRRQIEGEEPTFGLAATGEEERVAGATSARLAELRKQLDELLVEFTDKHPQVVALRDTIAQLETQREAEAVAERSRPRRTTGINALNINPVYQTMKIGLSSAEVEIATLRDEAGAKEREVARLRGLVTTIPDVEAQLARLNRDYEVTQQQHKALLQRLESARLSDNAEAAKEQLKFRIVEPPIRPLKPVGPNRALFLTMVLMASLASGLGLAFALNELHRGFTMRAELRAFANLPVLGVVSRLPLDAAAALRQRRLAFALSACAASLFVAFVLALLLASRVDGSGGGA